MASQERDLTNRIQPSLGKMLAKFLVKTAASPVSDEPGLLEIPGEVVPHQAAGAAVVEPRVAMEEAVEVAAYLLDPNTNQSIDLKLLKKAPEWASLVRLGESLYAIPFALANYPQLMRNISPLFHSERMSDLCESASKPVAVSGLEEWGTARCLENKWGEALFAAGQLRLARQFDAAGRLLKQIQGRIPAQWIGLAANEEAAFAWQRGDSAEAVQLWKRHPAPNSPAVMFNLGMAAVFTDRRAEAVGYLSRTIEMLPESSAWHHLARLYLALAE